MCKLANIIHVNAQCLNLDINHARHVQYGYRVYVAWACNPQVWDFVSHDALTVMIYHSALLQLHLAQLIAESAPKHALIFEVDSQGQITRSLHDQGGHVLHGAISHVLDLGDRLLLGSYEAPHAAVVPLDN